MFKVENKNFIKNVFIKHIFVLTLREELCSTAVGRWFKLDYMDEEIKKCLEVLRKGGLILYPTDTIWGVGCDATNAAAVKRVYALKQRDDNKALIVLLDSAEHLDHYVVDVPYMARELMDVAVKPLTIIYDGAFNVAPCLLGENDSLGIRVTQEPFTHKLCQLLGRPLVSTSANVSGMPAPASFAQVSDEIKNGVDYVVEPQLERDSTGKPSQIISVGLRGEIKVIR